MFIDHSLHSTQVALLAVDAMVNYCVKQSPQFLNPCAGEPVQVRAVVIDLVARDVEIRAHRPGVSRDAGPKVVCDYVVRDRDVLIWVRAFDSVRLPVRIVQVDLTIDDLARVDLE